jgi:hypothetical protein
MSLARAVSDEELSREILKAVGEDLKNCPSKQLGSKRRKRAASLGG